MPFYSLSFFFFFNDTATTEIYTLSLHDALPISDFREIDRDGPASCGAVSFSWPLELGSPRGRNTRQRPITSRDRKSTRLNSSHLVISYAVFCLKKKKRINCNIIMTRITMLW